jgi:SagB-type dehydrogenase family enzyme
MMTNDANPPSPAGGWLRLTELDAARFPEFRERIIAAEAAGPEHTPRSYPGYPETALPRPRLRRFASLDRTLAARRSVRELEAELPDRAKLARLCWLSHGCNASGGRGPVPSAGSLQSLELYLATLGSGWLEAGVHHYDRAGHHLSRLRGPLSREHWQQLVPSMVHFSGGSLLLIVVGDAARVDAKYGARGRRMLLLEAGHLMQNLCLVAASSRLAVLPLGGFFERAIGKELGLPATDALLYIGACGAC